MYLLIKKKHRKKNQKPIELVTSRSGRSGRRRDSGGGQTSLSYLLAWF